MKQLIPFSIFQVFFFTVMWTSKTLHPIFFESSGHLANFGLSYSAMALAGYFSFLTGTMSDQIGAAKTLGIGCVLYALGLFCRAYPESQVIAIFSGLIAGVGASLTLTSIRLWMLDLATDENKARWIGVKSSTTALGTAIGAALAGLLPGLTFLSISVKNLLMIVAITLFFVGLGILVFSHKRKSKVVSTPWKSPWNEVKKVYSLHRRLAIFTSIIGILTGIYVSFINPYLPLIMKDKGLSLGSIGLSIGAFSLIRFFVDPIIARWIETKKEKSLSIFLGSEILILIVTGLFALSISKIAFIGFLVLRSVALGFSTISEELLWIQKFPREIVGLLFGLNQSAFFVGDFLGGLVNGILYQKFGLSVCVAAAVVAIAINSYLFVILFYKKPNSTLTL